MKWAIYQYNIGNNYEPDFKLEIVSASDLTELVAKIPETATDIYVTDSEPVLHKLERILVLKGM